MALVPDSAATVADSARVKVAKCLRTGLSRRRASGSRGALSGTAVLRLAYILSVSEAFILCSGT